MPQTVHKKSAHQVMYLSRGLYEGRPTWHYILVDKLKLPLLLVAAKQGRVELSNYGKIIFSGFGEQPPKDIVSHVEKHYG